VGGGKKRKYIKKDKDGKRGSIHPWKKIAPLQKINHCKPTFTKNKSL
jgi:hypothetical protein